MGDWAARTVAENQPVKLAAMEGLQETEEGAGLTVGGIYLDGKVYGGIELPDMLSFLSYHDFDAKVEGLDAVPADDRPPVAWVRNAFQVMVGIGTFFALLAAWFLWARIRRGALPSSPWFYRAVVVAGPLGIVALISGWIVTEVGRQPWIVYELMRTEEAVTGAEGIPVGYATLAVVYAGLIAIVLFLLRRLARQAAPARSRRCPDAGRSRRRPYCSSASRPTPCSAAPTSGPGSGTSRPAGPSAGRASAGLVKRSMGPVWEANHVWLIFVLVVLWTCFPHAFGPIMETLYVPLFVAAVGIILRGAAFALRGEAATISEARALGATFALSSVLVPFFLGAVVGAVASGQVPADGCRRRRSRAGPTQPPCTPGCSPSPRAPTSPPSSWRPTPPAPASPIWWPRFRLRALGLGAVAGALALGGLAV